MARALQVLAAAAVLVAAASAALVVAAPRAADDATAARRSADAAPIRDTPSPSDDTTVAADADASPERPAAYTGTNAARRHVADASPPRPASAPTPSPATWREQPVADRDVDGYASRLAAASSYVETLRRLAALGAPTSARRDGVEPAPQDTSPEHERTRFGREPERLARVLEEAVLAARAPCSRQALIFHLALALPRAVAAPALARIAASGDADDAEDVLCAEAFTGDAAAVARFVDLAATPSDACHGLTIDTVADLAAVEAQGRRDVLRSYRCIEALDRAPYFHVHAEWLGYVDGTFPWAPPRGESERAVAPLVAAWLRRYPGHAGTDDMAWRLAGELRAEGRTRDAAHWASFGITQPDGDMRSACAELLVSIVELAPEGDPVAEDPIDPVAPLRHRDLLLYLRLRRHAQTLGFARACREVDDLAASEPDSLLARGWRERFSAPPSRGLDSGHAPIATTDALRRRDVRADLPDPPVEPVVQLQRHATPPEGELQPLRLARLRRQFRAWDALADIEQRAQTAQGADRVDLLYTHAAILYHEPDALYPVYATHDEAYSGRPRRWRAGSDVDEKAASQRATGWLRGMLAWDLAAARFEELARTEPFHELADDALYSAALAHVKAADDRAVRAAGAGERDRHLRAAVADFEALVTSYPRSSFAPDAGAALRYWRQERADLFR